MGNVDGTRRTSAAVGSAPAGGWTTFHQRDHRPPAGIQAGRRMDAALTSSAGDRQWNSTLDPDTRCYSGVGRLTLPLLPASLKTGYPLRKSSISVDTPPGLLAFHSPFCGWDMPTSYSSSQEAGDIRKLFKSLMRNFSYIFNAGQNDAASGFHLAVLLLICHLMSTVSDRRYLSS